MGIPKFFRWAGDRYPAMLSRPIGDGEPCPPVDNLYLDMNGIIHNCSHGNDGVLYGAMDAQIVLERVCAEVDRLVSQIVRPLQLVYIAVDGVAPRAKLNQQRSRRFRAARELKNKIELEGGVGESFFDSNCITPGTEFMQVMAEGLAAFAREAVIVRPAWNNLKVIFSGSDVPGEGEHKLVSFIRDEKAAGRMVPNTRHCIYGADADMMMLSIATHEKFVIVLREVVTFQNKGRGSGKVTPPSADGHSSSPSSPKPLQYIRVATLREYIVRELLEDVAEGILDEERILDDFVFLSFFIGNDFLPHLPGIHIGDKAFDILFDGYKTILAARPGYLLLEGGDLDLERLEEILALVGQAEEVVFSEQENARIAREHRVASHRHKAHGKAAIGHPQVPPSESSGESTPVSTGTADFRRQYYLAKFEMDISTDEGKIALRHVAREYLAGLQWCLLYYSTGCPSWSYFYPYHYGLFLQDLRDLRSLVSEISFSLSAPLTPFQQLLACLPPASCTLLPECYRWLMTDPSSPVIDFYPTDFSTDLNGMKMEYEAIVLLPFIDLGRLLAAEKEKCLAHMLTETERRRNQFGDVFVYTTEGDILITDRCKQSLAMGQRFEPRLLDDTLTARPGYAELQDLLATGQTFGKTRFSEKQLHAAAHAHPKGRANVFRTHGGKGGGRGGVGGGGEAFPMPGVPALPVLHLDAKAKFTHPTASLPHAPWTPEEGHGAELRLVMDVASEQFLASLGALVQQQVPAFHTIDDASDHVYSLRFNVRKLVSHFSRAAPSDAQLAEEVAKVSQIFGPLSGGFLPRVVSPGYGAIALLVQDRSHLAQIDQFLLQRFAGQEAFTT